MKKLSFLTLASIFLVALTLTGLSCEAQHDTNSNQNTNQTANVNDTVNMNEGPQVTSQCVYNGKFYDIGYTFAATDGCNTCTCEGSDIIICTELECDQNLTEPETTPSEVVENYMNYTLGTIPTASLDYEAAKDYLSVEMLSQFVDDSFVPLSYCIQMGPDDVIVDSEDISGELALVQVSSSYGSGWEEAWEFSLIIEDNEWKIDGIVCLGY